MNNRFRINAYFPILLLTAILSASQLPAGTIAFTVSMEQPSSHIFHVALLCKGFKAGTHEFRMPAWSPGYYGIMDFAGKVRNFHAEDGKGKELRWGKTSSNSWQVQASNAPVVQLTYDVLADISFVANPYLDEERGYIVGTGVFMYLAARIAHPVTVEIKPNSWKTIATSLDPVSRENPHVLVAPNFDVLYDSPILIGNLEFLPSFEIKGIPHHFIGYKLGNRFNGEQFIGDLKTVVRQGIAVIGEIPYKHYVFLGIGPGRGGIEHLNSATIPFTGSTELDTAAGRIAQLCFLAHEYFHAYNVKRIRPIALGPFDYDRENRTNMLWVSEGFTVYYEYLMVARAGLMDLKELLDAFHKDIASCEKGTGHLFQSATQSSWNTWTQGPFGGQEKNGISKSISYYAKGSVLGLLLDFQIRHATKNRKSLDTVMQALYRKYYKQLKRGWTDGEFRAVCESVAGVSLEEIFNYASTTRPIDYDKFLRYAGLELENPVEQPQAYLGVIAEDLNGKLVISAVEEDSPAQRTGLAAGDEIMTLDNAPLSATALNASIVNKKPGDKIKLIVTRAGRDFEADITLSHAMLRSYKIIPIANPDAMQSAILKDWIKAR